MKIIQIKRISKIENRYSQNMGRLITRVTYIKKYILGIPIKTLHAYRETYYGEIKDCSQCILEL